MWFDLFHKNEKLHGSSYPLYDLEGLCAKRVMLLDIFKLNQNFAFWCNKSWM